ncbi:MAG TPA: hypothetical protein VNW52_11365 [Burkholderiaceae bacterium]|jgi:hypothetical protein|nr:hypothetical protein [Burkholderiaceae bacterium]
MANTLKQSMTVRCACGSVELETTGAPILGATCYCVDCQEAGRQIEQLHNAPRVLDPTGGTDALLYRKDRLKYTKGAELLFDHKLKEGAPTRRVVARCCNSAMFLDFQKGHWFSVYRARFAGDVPPVQMRIQTKSRQPATSEPGDIPSYAGYPPKFMLKLLAAKIAMSLGL